VLDQESAHHGCYPGNCTKDQRQNQVGRESEAPSGSCDHGSLYLLRFPARTEISAPIPIAAAATTATTAIPAATLSRSPAAALAAIQQPQCAHCTTATGFPMPRDQPHFAQDIGTLAILSPQSLLAPALIKYVKRIVLRIGTHNGVASIQQR
jgi:hypothetical protein